MKRTNEMARIQRGAIALPVETGVSNAPQVTVLLVLVLVLAVLVLPAAWGQVSAIREALAGAPVLR